MFTGLEYLHRKGIVHRDVKPANLLVEGPEANPNLRIGDFGASCFERDLTPEGTAADKKGTPCFQAPEIVSFNFSLNDEIMCFLINASNTGVGSFIISHELICLENIARGPKRTAKSPSLSYFQLVILSKFKT